MLVLKSCKEPNPWQAQNQVLLIPRGYCQCCYSSSVVVTPFCWLLHKRILAPLSLAATFKNRKYIYSLIQKPTIDIDYFKHCANPAVLHSSSMAWFQHCDAKVKFNLFNNFKFGSPVAQHLKLAFQNQIC